jgi:hypothetical protein
VDDACGVSVGGSVAVADGTGVSVLVGGAGVGVGGTELCRLPIAVGAAVPPWLHAVTAQSTIRRKSRLDTMRLIVFLLARSHVSII